MLSFYFGAKVKDGGKMRGISYLGRITRVVTRLIASNFLHVLISVAQTKRILISVI